MLRVVAMIGLCACGRINIDPIVDDSDLLLHLAFERDGMLRDRSIGSHDGTCVACPTEVVGYDGGLAARFDGTACVHVETLPVIDATTFTFAAWTRWDVDQSATVFSRPFMADTAITNTFELTIFNSSVFVLSSGVAQASTQVPVGPWHHVAGVFDGTSLALYVDGAFITVAPAASTVMAGDDDVLIGCDVDRATAYAFLIGDIDDVRLYRRALSQDDVAALVAL
jgi:hypothetical protein